MKFNDGKTFSAYVRPKLHSGYITVISLFVNFGVNLSASTTRDEHSLGTTSR